jgi:hypothetical protein
MAMHKKYTSAKKLMVDAIAEETHATPQQRLARMVLQTRFQKYANLEVDGADIDYAASDLAAWWGVAYTGQCPDPKPTANQRRVMAAQRKNFEQL